MKIRYNFLDGNYLETEIDDHQIGDLFDHVVDGNKRNLEIRANNATRYYSDVKSVELILR